MIKYGFIGAGNMASAIIRGMNSKGFNMKNVFVTSKSFTSAENLTKDCKANALKTNNEVVNCSDVLILAVKPNMLSDIIENIKEDIKIKNPIIISIAAGKPLKYFSDILGEDISIIRVMPNINAKIGYSTSAFCTSKNVSAYQKDIVKNLFESVGSIEEIDEKFFDIYSVLGGASPAFAYLYIDAIARAAVKSGLPKKQALALSAKTVLGSAKMILESQEHPWELIDQVCSPGGTTIEGIHSLQSNSFESTITKAFDCVLEKDRKISKNN